MEIDGAARWNWIEVERGWAVVELWWLAVVRAPDAWNWREGRAAARWLELVDDDEHEQGLLYVSERARETQGRGRAAETGNEAIRRRWKFPQR